MFLCVLHRCQIFWNKIDSLKYSYYNGNQLGKVDDLAGANLAVGFQDKDNGSGYDYSYDPNGNLTSDFNKGMNLTTYNFLNLPSVVTIPGKGTITYTYDAAGNKLQKTTVDQSNKIINYYYAGDYVYRNDTLEFISHPEGRLRPVRIDTTQAITAANLKYIYDYFLKDNLGSVRSVLTTEQQTDFYAATMETANSTKENALFANISATDTAKPAGFGNDNNSHFVSKLNGDGNVGSIRVGPSIVLKVMTGDTISISTYSWYKGNAQPPPVNAGTLALELVPLLLNGVGGQNGGKGGAVPTSFTDPALGDDITNFLSGSRAYDNLRPKAYLNWMVVGEDYTAANSSYNHVKAMQIPTCAGGDTSKQIVGLANMVVRRNGWIYIYLSNESAQSVYFDNLVINLRHGPLVEQKEYYAFGMENPALSTKAIKYNYNENRIKYNGIEYDTAFGLDEYEAHYRELDPQIGRWTTIDPSPTESESPYSSMGNNPISKMDPLGDTLVFPGASQGFIDQFYDAYSDLEAHGVGDVLDALQRLPDNISIVQRTTEDGQSPGQFVSSNNTIYWDPTTGAGVSNGVVISPTTIVDHEASHALQYYTNPKQFNKDVDPKTGADSKYKNKEERRVITKREQKVARALGEIKKGQVTRTDHDGHGVRVKNPTSNDPLINDSMLKRLKEQEKFYKDRIKNKCIGCDGPCCKIDPNKKNGE